MSHYEEHLKTARKQHHCNECQNPILKGELYFVGWGVQDGFHYNLKLCIPCQQCAVVYCRHISPDGQFHIGQFYRELQLSEVIRFKSPTEFEVYPEHQSTFIWDQATCRLHLNPLTERNPEPMDIFTSPDFTWHFRDRDVMLDLPIEQVRNVAQMLIEEKSTAEITGQTPDLTPEMLEALKFCLLTGQPVRFTQKGEILTAYQPKYRAVNIPRQNANRFRSDDLVPLWRIFCIAALNLSHYSNDVLSACGQACKETLEGHL